MPRMAYVSFDTVPAPKGASTHIEAFARGLASRFGAIDLVTVADSILPPPPEERWPGVLHHRLPASGPSLIDRVLCFRAFFAPWLTKRKADAVQFRSIFEGMPLLHLDPRPKLIFEVNGLPSIELKSRYPRVIDDRELMAKIIAQETACVLAADRIVTPSAVTKAFLVEHRCANAERVRVIPNGVDTDLFTPGPPAWNLRLLYFGTLAAWQGIDLAVRAVAQLAPRHAVTLTILGAGNHRQTEALSSLAAKLGVGLRVEILPPVDQQRLAQIARDSLAVLAPLALTERNVRQGCCPLKVIEGMACGVPVIASDLPVVRELGEHERHLLLVKPGSVDQIAGAVERLILDPQLRLRIGQQARRHVEDLFTWKKATDSLAGVYGELGLSP